MSKLVEAAAEFLARDTSTKGNEFSEAMHPMKKGKKEMEENFLLSQEDFQSLSEEDQEYYVDQLIELKNGMMKSKMGKRSKMM